MNHSSTCTVSVKNLITIKIKTWKKILHYVAMLFLLLTYSILFTTEQTYSKPELFNYDVSETDTLLDGPIFLFTRVAFLFTQRIKIEINICNKFRNI